MKPKDKLQLIKPAVANLPAITPPPRKEDIINAMVERARIKHQEEIDRLSAKREEAEEKFKQAVLEELRKNPQNFTTYVRNYSKPEVEYTMDVIPPAIARLKDAIRQAPTIRNFDPVAAKKSIRESLGAFGNLLEHSGISWSLCHRPREDTSLQPRSREGNGRRT